MRLEGKVAIITGAASGMGAEEARIFAREGARVVVADVQEDDGRQVEAEIAEAGGEAVFLRLDVTSEDSWKSVVAETVSRFGKLDLLVNNAGIVVPRDDLSEESWYRVMDVNAKGVFLGMKHAIPEMRKVGGGSIVNISSISGNIGQDQVNMGYNASKGAVRIVTNRRRFSTRRRASASTPSTQGRCRQCVARQTPIPRRWSRWYSRRSPWDASDAQRRWATLCSSWQAMKPHISPGPSWWWTAAFWRSRARRSPRRSAGPFSLVGGRPEARRGAS